MAYACVMVVSIRKNGCRVFTDSAIALVTEQKNWDNFEQLNQITPLTVQSSPLLPTAARTKLKPLKYTLKTDRPRLLPVLQTPWSLLALGSLHVTFSLSLAHRAPAHLRCLWCGVSPSTPLRLKSYGLIHSFILKSP